ncbi:MAG: hypothetical protein GX316_02020 [Firmicutes bacterium]|nr:hypothetical protein [Bacillota bacterium]
MEQITPPTSSKCVWIMSDTHFIEPEDLEIFYSALDDIQELEVNLTGIWLLGDIVGGHDMKTLDKTAEIFVEHCESLGVPICYVMGNHEMDIRRSKGINRFPIHEAALKRPNWHAACNLTDFYFSKEFLGHRVYFFGDHVAEDAGWFTSHGEVVSEGNAKYPHLPEGYVRLKEEMAHETLPIITAAHYAFPGGQRASGLLDHLLPLPKQVRVHLYGHGHIGDPIWNPIDTWEREHTVKGQDLMQYNISSFETYRTPGSFSALLFGGPDEDLDLWIRCHVEKRWVAHYVIPKAETKAV